MWNAGGLYAGEYDLLICSSAFAFAFRGRGGCCETAPECRHIAGRRALFTMRRSTSNRDSKAINGSYLKRLEKQLSSPLLSLCSDRLWLPPSGALEVARMADLDHASDDDDAVSQLAGPSRLPAGRAASRRAGSRASSVASSTAAAGGPASRASHASSNGAGSSAATVAHGLPTSRPRARTSVSVTPEESGLPTSEATLESDTPAVAAYNSHAAARRNGASRTPPPRARAKPKRPALDPEAQKALERRRQKEEAEDDFFTRKPVLTFRTKKTASKADSSSTSSKQTVSASLSLSG